ncbi:MAG: epimerase [Cyclobacteriaceae bacterium]|nr:epimerase [Cyclobacteriaceae bacterium]
MKVIIFGSSGMIGKGVLLECLDHSKIDEVLVINRSSVGIAHPKLKETLHSDFSNFNSIADQMAGFDACYFCLGLSAAEIKEADYRRITYDFTLAAARTLYSGNPVATFIYVSGQGTDSTEKGRVMWARVKGKTENDILKMGFNQAFAFRPGAIIPLRGVTPSSKMYRMLITNLTWLIKLVKRLAPNSVVDSTQIGLAMINATLLGYEKKIIRPIDLLSLSKIGEQENDEPPLHQTIQ